MSEDATRERLADYAHSAWSGWMKYQFSKAELQPDGTWLMPAWAVERWTRQMNTPYAELPEEEKKSDRKEADEILAIVGEQAAYERGKAKGKAEGKAEERARIREALKAERDSVKQRKERSKSAWFGLVWQEREETYDKAINIVNQTK